MNLQDTPRRQFASDNYAGICPEAFAALQEANHGHICGYGDDPWTEKAASMIRDLFETDCDVFFVFNGTAANALSLAALCQPYNRVICHEHSHIETGESGAPEFFTGGSKLILMPGANGKIDAAAIEAAVARRSDVHFPKAGAVSITHATEAGTAYSIEELRAIGETSRRLGLRLHMDGARFANAVASLGVTPKECTWKIGVDVLSFGGTKNGMAVGDAVVFFNQELAKEFEYRRKQTGQLASKMRFISAPWIGVLRDGAWLRHAAHANAMARKLEAALRPLTGTQIVFPCDTNGVFVKMPLPVIEGLQKRGWKFYPHVNEDDIRLLCSWDTTDDDINAFAADLKVLLRKTPAA